MDTCLYDKFKIRGSLICQDVVLLFSNDINNLIYDLSSFREKKNTKKITRVKKYNQVKNGGEFKGEYSNYSKSTD